MSNEFNYKTIRQRNNVPTIILNASFMYRRNQDNEIRLNSITIIEQVEEALGGEFKDVCEEIGYAVVHKEVKAVAGMCTSIINFENCTKYRIADHSGKLTTINFGLRQKIQKIIIITFNYLFSDT